MVVDGKMSETEITFFVYAGGLLGFTSNILTKLWKTARQCWKQPNHWQKSLLVRMPLSATHFALRIPLYFPEP